MKGLELSKKFYKECGAPMLHENFPELEGILAIGLVGAGSECFGYDDDISTDHDFEPGFCIFLPGEDKIDRKLEFQLERAYSKLPREFEGIKRLKISPVGGNRHGVIRTSDFYESKTGYKNAPSSLLEWFSIPDTYLAEATNGEIFRDDLGEFTAIRNTLLTLPDDVRIKKIAGNLLLMAQSGQYNYERCIAHGETGAAQLAIFEFVSAAISAAFLLSGKHMPFYKWRFRALRDLNEFSCLAPILEWLITTENTPNEATLKICKIEEIAGIFIAALNSRNLTDAICGDLEKHAYSVNDKIVDSYLRNTSVLYGV